ncbi:MAG: hypothetical protein QM784_31400 [Polyangiaceae bacterium]
MLILAVFTPACEAPDVSLADCIATCDAGCPDGMECRNGYCVHQDMKGSCMNAEAGTGGKAGSTSQPGTAGAGTGGTSNVAGAAGTEWGAGGSEGAATNTALGGGAGSTAAMGGSGNHGGMGGAGTATVQGGNAGTSQGGTGGSASTGQLVVAMDPVLPQQLCTGGEYRTALTVTGGNASYVFQQLQTFSALTVTVTGPNSADVTVKPTQAGTYAAISITDGSNPPTQVSFTIGDTPRVTTTTLRSACLGEIYSEALSASGGGNYEWTGEVPAALGLSLTSDGKLTGVVKATGTFGFDVTVRDKASGCSSAKQRVEIAVLNDTHVDCPRISVKQKPNFFLAPAACRAQNYTAAFEVNGGVAPYSWAATSTPAGLAFDALTQVLSGVPNAGGDFTIRVTDKIGRTVVRTFPIPLRDKCWLGFVTTDSGAARMQIFDPIPRITTTASRQHRCIARRGGLQVFSRRSIHRLPSEGRNRGIDPVSLARSRLGLRCHRSSWRLGVALRVVSRR